jgi:ankyrin repeat protein
LVALGALLDATDAQGRTALHVAVSKGNRNAIKLLLCIGASSAVKTLKGETAYEMTKDKAIHELMAAYEKVLGSCPANGEGKLHAAVRLGDADAILALSKIEDVYQRDKQGRTPLHKAVSQKNLSLLRTVIEVASDLEVEDGQGKTPLFIAAMEVQDPALVRFLLKAGANPLTGLKDGTSLLTAIKQAEESKSLNDILKLIENYK